MTTLAANRLQGALRTGLIGYGIAAYGYLRIGSESAGNAQTFGLGGSASGFLLSGLALQILLILAQVLIRRVFPDHAVAAQAIWIVELIADGVTVLLFALGTLGAILPTADGL